MSATPKPTKTRGKRTSAPPEPTGDSSDSGRARSLSPGRSSSRRVTSAKAAAQSKWNLSASQTIDQSSSDSDKDNFTDSVSRRVKFRRSKELKDFADGVNAAALSKFKIPKKAELKLDVKTTPTDPSSAAKQNLLAPSGAGLAGDAGDPSVVVGYSGKVLGYRNPADPAESAGKTENFNPEMYVAQGVEIPLRSKIGSGCYLPLVPLQGPGSGQPKLTPQGANLRLSPYPKSKPKNSSVNVTDQSGTGSVAVGTEESNNSLAGPAPGVDAVGQCCAILIGIGAISVLKSKIFDTFGIVSVLVLKEVS